MAMFSKKNMGYKVSVFLFCVGLAAFVTGFATPHWSKFEFSIGYPPPTPWPFSASTPSPQPGWVWTWVEGHTGLWTYCYKVGQYGESSCEKVSSSSPGWMTAVKVVDCVAVGTMGLVLLFFYFTNCVARKAAFTRLLEVGAAFSGLLGVGGAVMYMWKSYTGDDLTASMHPHGKLVFALSWSFYLSAGGSIVVLLAAVLIAAFNFPPEAPKSHRRHGKTRRVTRTSTRANFTRPSAPPLPSSSFSSGTTGATSTMAQSYRPSGSNPYVISAAMTANREAPKLYPSLQDLHEEQPVE